MENMRNIKSDYHPRKTSIGGANILLIMACIGLFMYGFCTTVIIYSLKREKNHSAQKENKTMVSTEALASLVSEALFDKMGNTAKKVLISDVVSGAQIPLIFTDNSGDPMIWFNIEHGPRYNRQAIDYDDSSATTKLILKEKVKEFEKKYAPKVVYYNDNLTKIGWLYFDDGQL